MHDSTASLEQEQKTRAAQPDAIGRKVQPLKVKDRRSLEVKRESQRMDEKCAAHNGRSATRGRLAPTLSLLPHGLSS